MKKIKWRYYFLFIGLISFFSTHPVNILKAEELNIGHLETNDIPDEIGWLWFKCTKEKNTIDCDIFQTSISQEETPIELQKQISLIKSKNNGPDFEKSFGDFCAGNNTELQHQLEQMKSSGKSIDGRQLRPKEISIALNSLQYLVNACRTKSSDDINLFLINMEQMKADTCSVLNNVNHETFNYDQKSDSWISQTGPAGPCGVLNITALRKDPKSPNFWLYSDTRITSNPNGYLKNGMACKGFPTRTYNYSWQAKNNILECTQMKNMMH